MNRFLPLLLALSACGAPTIAVGGRVLLDTKAGPLEVRLDVAHAAHGTTVGGAATLCLDSDGDGVCDAPVSVNATVLLPSGP